MSQPGAASAGDVITVVTGAETTNGANFEKPSLQVGMEVILAGASRFVKEKSIHIALKSAIHRRLSPIVGIPLHLSNLD
jgi:hypothetical protein